MNSIDRLEGNYAVIETEDGFLEIPRSELPETAAEGDILVKTENGWMVDAQETENRRAMLLRRRQRLLNGGKS